MANKNSRNKKEAQKDASRSRNSKSRTNDKSRVNDRENTRFDSNTSARFTATQKDNCMRNTSDSESSQHSYNDYSWYNKYPELLNEVARLPFPNVPGMRIKDAFIGNFSKNYTSKGNDINIPGVMTLDFIPLVGKSSSPSDPVSSAARELYTRVRARFSGSLKADAPDMMIHTLAQEQIYAYIAYLRRLYRTINSYSSDNIGMAEVLFAGLGFKKGVVQELQAHKPDFLNMINTFIRMMDGLILPEVFTVQDRHVWMLDKVFSDINSTKGQLIQFKPIGFYRFGLLDTPDTIKAGGLIFDELSFENVEPSNVLSTLHTYGLNLINSFKSWESCYVINGYFSEAFGNSAWGQAFVIADEILTLYYDPYVLEQIANCTPPPREAADSEKVQYSINVSQDPNTNTLLSAPSVTISGLASTDSLQFNNVLNIMTMNNPPNEEIVEATRLKTVYTITKVNGTTIKYDIDGATECVIAVYLSSRLYNEQTGAYEYTREPMPTAYVLDLSAVKAEQLFYNTLRLATVSQWDFFPMIPVFISDNGTRGFYSLFGDLRNVTTLSDTELNNLNRICLYSMFNSFGK